LQSIVDSFLYELVKTGHFCLLIVFLWEGEQTDKAIKDGMECIMKSRILCDHSFTNKSLERSSVFGIRKPGVWLIRHDHLKDVCRTQSLGKCTLAIQFSL
jgi:hypothetical protein